MNLYLIGMRGSGKTTVAPLLAEAIGWSTVDSDTLIEVATGQAIAEIFDAEGEAGFRQWETTILQAIAVSNEQVVSLGGGAVLSEVNREVIRGSGKAVLLSAPAEVLLRRVAGDSKTGQQRPSLKSVGGLEELRELLAERQDVYRACADYTIDTSQLNPQQIADAIANWWDPVDM